MSLNFFTDTGIEVPAVTQAQMVELDRIAMDETGPNLVQMMENAGRNLALEAIATLGTQWQQASIVVLAGNGGNGGGGICCARHLANRGANVQLCLASPDRLKDVPQWQRKIFQATPGQEVSAANLLGGDQPFDFIIDALIGYSLQSNPRGVALELIQWANHIDAPILSLDMPSGIDATTGESPGDSMQAQRTMTLALPKSGLLPGNCGALTLADIGIPAQAYCWETLKLNYRSPFDDRFRVPLYWEAQS